MKQISVNDLQSEIFGAVFLWLMDRVDTADLPYFPRMWCPMEITALQKEPYVKPVDCSPLSRGIEM